MTFFDFKSLSNHLSPGDAQRSKNVGLIFEHLLIGKSVKRKWSDDCKTPLMDFSYYFRRNGLREKADLLDSLIGKLYNNVVEENQVESLQIFLCSLANVDQIDRRNQQSPISFTFTKLSTPLRCEKSNLAKTLRFNAFDTVPASRLPKICAHDFPLVPTSCREAQSKDRSDSIVRLKEDQSFSDKQRVAQTGLVSQLNGADFSRFWSDRLANGPYRLIDQGSLPTTLAVPQIEFQHCFKALVCGIPSRLFARQGNAMQQIGDVTVCGLSSSVVRGVVGRGIQLGNCVLELIDFISLLKSPEFYNSPALRSFRLALISAIRLQEKKFTESFQGSSGLVGLAAKCEAPFFQQLLEISRVVRSHLETGKFTAKWLLDFLYAACMESYVSPEGHAFSLVVFLQTLQLHLEWFQICLRDIPSLLEIDTEEFFIQIDKEAIFLSDRRFWINAIKLREDKLPNFFLPLMKDLLWTAKMNCLLYRLKIQNPVLQNQISRNQFSLKAVEDDTYSVGAETILENLTSNLELLLRNSMKSLKQIIKSDAVFGQAQLLSICSDLRSIFLFADSEFSSILVEEIFGQLLWIRQSIASDKDRSAIDLLDVYSLNRSLERASNSKWPSKRSDKLSLGFMLLPSTTSSQLSIVDCVQLNCVILWPANIIYTETSMESYQKAFNLFLKLRLSIYSLSESKNRLLERSTKHDALLRHRVLVQIREIDLFARNFATYLLHQVLDVSWSAFLKEANVAFQKDYSVDSIYEIHNKYLFDVITRCLLNPSASALLKVVEKLLGYAMEFGVVALSFTDKMSEVQDQLEQLFDRFKRVLNLFYSVLCKLAARGYQPHLNDLLLRMNFNDYYDKEITPASIQSTPA